MLDKLINYLNQNQGLIAVCIFILGIIGFCAQRLLFSEARKNSIQKLKSGDNSINIQSGRDVHYGDKQSKIG
jgi:hypothetical protein